MINRKIYIVTKQELDNAQRKIVFFSRQPKGLYLDVGGFFMGSHTSYHSDGNIFRTSPATSNYPRMQGNHLPLTNFKGWYQLGTSMISKDSIKQKPAVKKRDLKEKVKIHEVDLDLFPSDTLNFVIELLEPDKEEFLSRPSIAPPPQADIFIVKDIEPWIVLTILGHDDNLLIKPIEDGFSVSHINTRYSTNQPGVNYTYEAYG